MNILLTGSVAFDYLMTFPGFFRDHILPEHLDSISLSFLVDSMRRVRGGIAPNIAYTLALFGEKPRLWATVGEDFEDYRLWLEAHGIDASGARVIPGEFTASFFVNTDRANNQIASFYPGAMGKAAQLSLTELVEQPPELVMISPNDPAAMDLYVQECRSLGFDYIYDPSQQIVRMKPDELCAGLEGALALFVNEYEFALIQNLLRCDPLKMMRRISESSRSFVVITRGNDGATVLAEGQTYHIPVVKPERILDPTGVGDAFRGGFLAGYGHNLDWETCGQMGALAATYCLEQVGTQGHSFTPDEFVRRFRSLFNDQGKLDFLCTSEVR